MATKTTRTVRFIRKGEQGAQGATLRGPQAWTDCAVGYYFQAGAAGESWLDVVVYNNNYYVCKKSHSKTANNYPGSTAAENNGLWQLGDKIALMATNLLLSTYALIKNLGVEAIEMKNSAGQTVFLAKDGQLKCDLGTFNNITVQSGKIAGFQISGNGLTNTPFDNDAYIIFRNDAQGAFAGMGGNILPASTGLRGVARFENKDTTDVWGLSGNYAVLLAAQGARENCALHIDGGYISGLALRNKLVENTTTLGRFDQHILTINTSAITITLPTMQLYDDGHIIRIKRLGSGSVKIALGYCYTFNGTASRYTRPILVYDKNTKLTGTNTLSIDSECDAMELVWVRDIQYTISNVTYYGAWVQYKMPRDW